LAPDYQNVLDRHVKLTQNYHYIRESYKTDIKVRYCKDEGFLTVNTLIAHDAEVFPQLVNTKEKDNNTSVIRSSFICW